MFTYKKPRSARMAAMMAVLMLLGVVLLTLAFSSPVRAAVLQFIGAYNGVHIAIDPETDSLVVSGNTEAVSIQNKGEVFITNATGDEAVAVIRPDTEKVPLVDLLERYPDFTLPNDLPQGYVVDEEAILFEYEGRRGLMVLWHNATGERLSLYRGIQPENEVGTVEMRYVVTADLQGNDHAQLTWEADGFFYQIIATDESLGEPALRAMAQ